MEDYEWSCLHRNTNQRDDKMKSEGGFRQKLKHADGDFPHCMRRRSEDNETKMIEKRRFHRKRRRQTQNYETLIVTFH